MHKNILPPAARGRFLKKLPPWTRETSAKTFISTFFSVTLYILYDEKDRRKT